MQFKDEKLRLYVNEKAEAGKTKISYYVTITSKNQDDTYTKTFISVIFAKEIKDKMIKALQPHKCYVCTAEGSIMPAKDNKVMLYITTAKCKQVIDLTKGGK